MPVNPICLIKTFSCSTSWRKRMKFQLPSSLSKEKFWMNQALDLLPQFIKIRYLGRSILYLLTFRNQEKLIFISVRQSCDGKNQESVKTPKTLPLWPTFSNTAFTFLFSFLFLWNTVSTVKYQQWNLANIKLLLTISLLRTRLSEPKANRNWI